MNAYTPDTATTSTITRIADLVRKGVEAWQEAGLLLVSILDEHPQARKHIESQGWLSPAVLNVLEKLGRRQIHPRLLLCSGPGNTRLAQMPYSIQELHASEPVELLVHNGTDYDTILVSVPNLSNEQAEQVFDLRTKTVRSTAAQRAFIEDVRAKATETVTNGTPIPYEIRGNQVIVLANTKWTKAQLKRLIDQLA